MKVDFPEDEPASDGVVAQFNRVRTQIAVVGVSGFLVGMGLIIGAIGLNSLGLAMLGFFVMCALAVYINLIVYRCPRCGGYPGRVLLGYPRHCARCSARLR